MSVPAPIQPRVTILLSTFQGEAFVDEQLMSLFTQDWPHVRIVVRDDGSTDGTWRRLEAHGADGRIVAIRGENIGPLYSFLSLLDHAEDSDVIMFADQDDVWHTDKVRRAVETLGRIRPGLPALYCSGLEVVDASMKTVGQSPKWPRRPSFGNALVENVATGCTIALNRPAVELIKSTEWPRAAVMHDWWCYLVAAAFGEVVYDPEPSLKYRQHGSNAVGIQTDHVARLAARIRRQMETSVLTKMLAQAREFDRLFGARLDPEKRSILNRFTGIDAPRGRLRFLASRDVRRQFAADTVALKGLVLLSGRHRLEPSSRR